MNPYLPYFKPYPVVPTIPLISTIPVPPVMPLKLTKNIVSWDEFDTSDGVEYNKAKMKLSDGTTVPVKTRLSSVSYNYWCRIYGINNKKIPESKRKMIKQSAIKRIMRDIKELKKAKLESISAEPLENNIFEFHVNIKPTNGVYSGVYFHLLLRFPDNYPELPPKINMQTSIKHPNIIGSYVCLNMLDPKKSNKPYQGWSSSYTLTSILMQLQSFLLAEKIDQDFGLSINAQLSDFDVKNSIEICKKYQCPQCGHKHDDPKPEVIGPKVSLIKVLPLNKEVDVLNSSCQTTHTYWVGAYGNFGCNYGKVMYEVFVNWTGDKWNQFNIRGGLCRFGWGTAKATVCGRDIESFGYGGTGMYSYANNFTKFGESFTKDDTITCAIDFDNGIIHFAKNGKILESHNTKYIPDYIWNLGESLYPLLSFKNSRAEFNFGEPKKPVKFLIKNGFKTLEQIVIQQQKQVEKDNKTGEDINGDMKADDTIESSDDKNDNKHKKDLTWIDTDDMNDNIWINIFEFLDFYSIYRCEIVCKKFGKIIRKYNIRERCDVKCFYSKLGLFDSKTVILGIGLCVSRNQHGKLNVASQWDIVSLDAFKLGNNTGVWGEKITHFLPLILNEEHIERCHEELMKRISIIINEQNWWGDQNRYENWYGDLIIEIMNNIVVQLVMNDNTNQNILYNNINDINSGIQNNEIKLQLCEKALVGYCSLHHILLYLMKYYKEVQEFANKKIESFKSKNGTSKHNCKDLGKLLIYLMISKYNWSDIAKEFTLEVFVRNVRWYTKDCNILNTSRYLKNRLNLTFKYTSISRKLVLFQIWFMNNFKSMTLKDYNDKLGRPSIDLRCKLKKYTKKMLQYTTWNSYFRDLNIMISKDFYDIDPELHLLLQWSVQKSHNNKYHTCWNDIGIHIKTPNIQYYDPCQPGSINTFEQQNGVNNNNNEQINALGRGIQKCGFNSRRGPYNNNYNSYRNNRGRRYGGRGRRRGRGRGRGRGFYRGRRLHRERSF